VFAPAPNVFTAVIKHWAVVPYSAALKQLSAFDGQGQILIVPADSVSQARVKDEITGALRGMRGLRPGDPDEFALIESAQILAMIDRFAPRATTRWSRRSGGMASSWSGPRRSARRSSGLPRPASPPS
jgi:hypothetical protein